MSQSFEENPKKEDEEWVPPTLISTSCNLNAEKLKKKKVEIEMTSDALDVLPTDSPQPRK